ncbi:4'-phosphopantetheinyl transferase family protein [Shewanella atlantica]|uniref:4'-phosphopantetheinyl transferase family protein n=1 Tax=Shewanella atlantica TaxID=271099 RepID=UPI003734E2B6
MSPAQVQLIHSWLSTEESAKVSRFTQASARDRGLMVRGYLRGILSLCSGFEGISCDRALVPGDWRFQYGDKGKPSLVPEQREKSGLEFNISHSGDWLLIAVIKDSMTAPGHIELGVDIERYRASTDIYPILNHYFTQDESDSLLALDEEGQRDRFFDLWALKESYIKAKGLGLALSLKTFSFGFTQVREGSLALYEDNTLIESLSLLSHLDLYIHDEGSSARQNEEGRTHLKIADDEWSVFLGRLDSEYRFAVTVGSRARYALDADKMELACLLARYQ